MAGVRWAGTRWTLTAGGSGDRIGVVRAVRCGLDGA